MATLTMTLSYDYGKDMALSLKEWFERDAMEPGDKYVSLARSGLLRRWQLTYHIHGDTLTTAQYRWMLLHMQLLAKTRFTTYNIGFIGLRQGEFTMTMRK